MKCLFLNLKTSQLFCIITGDHLELYGADDSRLLLPLVFATVMEENQAESSGSQFVEEGRGCRTKRKQTELPTSCPVCSVTLRPTEVDGHFTAEIEKLQKITSTKHRANGKTTGASGSAVNGGENAGDKCWETYQKIKANRQNRQRAKARKRRAEEVVCPICNRETSEDINLHVEMCLRRSEGNGGDSDENIDVEGFEEYEWAGQSRVRVTSLLEGGVSNLGTSLSMADEDEDLVVDGDDAQLYGSPQYFERDVILPGNDREQIALRRAVLESYGEKPEIKNVPEKMDVEDTAKEDPVLEVLKKRIAELESREQEKEAYKCLICMERYRTPVISVSCWHVHCEQCWLQTLGAKKLCPQCNMITSPADLRRIYM